MSVQVTDISGLVHEYLVDEYGESQQQRARGYFKSQSFKELIEFLDDEQIIAMKASRHVKNKSESYPSLSQGQVGDYTKTEEELKVAFNLDYERKKHGQFDSSAVMDTVKEKDLEDLPVDRLVFRVEESDLYDRIKDLLINTIGLPDKNEFTEPLYFEMESRQADTKHLKRQVKDYHDSHYFVQSGLGWHYRTMDLMAIWSHNAYTKSKNVLFTDPNAGRKLNMRDVENLAFNQYDSDSPKYGAVNSKLVINQWRSIFGRGRTDMRLWEWDSTEEWVREK